MNHLRLLLLLLLTFYSTLAFLWPHDNTHTSRPRSIRTSEAPPLPALESDQAKIVNTGTQEDSRFFSFYKYLFGSDDTVTTHVPTSPDHSKTTSHQGRPTQASRPWEVSSSAYFAEATRRAEEPFSTSPSRSTSRQHQDTSTSYRSSLRSRTTLRTSTDSLSSFQTSETRHTSGLPFTERLSSEDWVEREEQVVINVPRKGDEETVTDESQEDKVTDGFEEKRQNETARLELTPTSPLTPCSTCGRSTNVAHLLPGSVTKGMSEEEVVAIRRSMVADLLMRKMRLDPTQLRSPNGGKGVDRDASAAEHRAVLSKFPRAVLDQTMRGTQLVEELDDFYARDQEAIVTGRDMGRDCVDMRSTGCFDFRFTREMNSEVKSAELWLYKTRDRHDIHRQTFIVYEIERDKSQQTLRRRNLIARKDTIVKEGWVTLNVSRAVGRWVTKRRSGEMLAVRCKTCFKSNSRVIFGAKENYQPVLVIQFHDHRRIPKRRSVENCNPTVECCKRNLDINFNDIGIPTIMQPETLSVGYCYGYCNGVNTFTYNHTAIKYRMRMSDSTTEETRNQLMPCCVPTVLKDTFVLTAQDGMATLQILPKVIVERCGCV